MNLQIARAKVLKYYSEDHFFIYNGSRGFSEEFHGTIKKVFSRCFLIETSDHKWKCFSYSDYIIKSILIY